MAAACFILGAQALTVGQAVATCASGDGNVEPGTCTNPQNLSGTSGTVSTGATLTTGATSAYTISGTNATLTNLGTITDATVPNTTVFAIGSGANISNFGTISNTSPTSGGGGAAITTAVGISLNSVSNAGTISSTAGNGILAGAVSGNLTNSGTINALGGVSNSGVVGIFAGGVPDVTTTVVFGNVTNTGSITGGSGIEIQGSVAGSISNSGTITSTGTSGFILAGIGVAGNVLGNVTNSGTISSTQGTALDTIAENGSAFRTNFVAGNVVNSGSLSGFIGLQTAIVRGALTNSGTIQGQSGFGLDLLGTVQGGITNTASGKIEGQQGVGVGVFALEGPGLNNAGLISSQSGTAIVVAGVPAVPPFFPAFAANLNLTNTGTIIGGGGTALDYTGATTSSTINQAGGAIIGDILLSPFGDTVNVTGGTIAGNINGNAAVNGANAGTVNFALGNGTFTTGGTINAANININSGTVVLANDVTVFNALTNNATLQLNTTGPRTITGSFVQNGSGTFGITLTPSSSSRLDVTNTATLNGGNVQVLAQSGSYSPQTKYTILTANGGVSGAFSGVSTNFAFLDPSLSYDAHDVFLSLNATSFSTQCRTSNQCGVSGALNASPISSPLVLAVLDQNVTGAAQALDALSGEVYATAQTVMLDDSLFFRQAVLDRLRQSAYSGGSGPIAALGTGGPALAYADGSDASVAPLGYADSRSESSAIPLAYADSRSAFPIKAPPVEPQTVFWAQGIGAFGRITGDGNAATVNPNLAGIFTGADRRFGPNWLAGIATGYTNSNFSIADNRGSSANIDTGHLAGYVGANYGNWNLRGAASASLSTLGVNRSIAFPGFSDTASSSYNALTAQTFGEVGYGMTFGRAAAEPFAGLAWVHLSTQGVAEGGGSGIAALTGAGANDDIGYSTLGARAALVYLLTNNMVLMPRATAAWQHAFGSVTPTEALTFQSTGAPFVVAGVPLARDAALVQAGFDLRITPRISVGLFYFGELASNVQDHAVQGNFTWRF
jgi:outer membrane autotransporter protein